MEALIIVVDRREVVRPAANREVVDQQLVYSLAWLRANGEPVHPEFKTQMEEWLEKYEAEDA